MSEQQWRFIVDGFHSARHNMEADCALMSEGGQGLIQPTVRVYGWSEPAITVGYSQQYESELDVDRCRAEAIDIVRRPTGGRALLHHLEVTYAVAAPVSLPPFDRGLKATFGAVSEALLAGLRTLGVRGDLNTHKRPSSGGPRRSPACFAALNHCEITVDGKKLVGSAQKRTARSFLQHGSLILEPDHDRFVSLLKFECEERREDMRRHLLHSTTGLSEVCGRPVSFQEAAEALREGFRQTFSGHWTEEEILLPALKRVHGE